MSFCPNIVVLTATIDPSVSNVNIALNNAGERLNQYLDNIRKIIVNTNVSNIVFCENSNFLHDYSELQTLAEQHGKSLEVLTFMGSNEIIRAKGKSYGEAEILNYAVDNSVLLRGGETAFFKLTGRIFVNNIDEILSSTQYGNIFIRWDMKKKEVDTRFFKVQVDFYKEHLYGLLDCMDEGHGLSIEEVYYNNLKGNPSIRPFAIYPDIRGICASLGKPYDLGLFKSLYRKLQLKAGLLDLRRCT